MENYELKTPVGEANIPKNSHPLVMLNLNVATAIKASDVKAASFLSGSGFYKGSMILFKKEYAQDPFEHFAEYVDDTEFQLANEFLYEKTGSIIVPLARSALAGFLSEHEIFDNGEAGQKLASGHDFSRREIREAAKYFENSEIRNPNLRIHKSELEKLLSLNPGSPSGWPWRKLREGYGIDAFSEEIQRMARIYSRVEDAVGKIRNGTSNEKEVTLEGMAINLSKLFALKHFTMPFSNYLAVPVVSKADSDSADFNILTLESGGMPEAIKPLYSDLWELAEHLQTIEIILESLLLTYAYDTAELSYNDMSIAALIAAYDLIEKNPYLDRKLKTINKMRMNRKAGAAAAQLVEDFKSGKISDSDITYEHTQALVGTFDYIASIIPEDFMDIRSKREEFQLFMSRNHNLDKALIRKKDLEIRSEEEKIAEEFQMEIKSIRYFFKPVYLQEQNDRPGITEDGCKRLYEKMKFGFISKEEAMSTLRKYSLMAFEPAIAPLFL